MSKTSECVIDIEQEFTELSCKMDDLRREFNKTNDKFKALNEQYSHVNPYNYEHRLEH